MMTGVTSMTANQPKRLGRWSSLRKAAKIIAGGTSVILAAAWVASLLFVADLWWPKGPTPSVSSHPYFTYSVLRMLKPAQSSQMPETRFYDGQQLTLDDGAILWYPTSGLDTKPAWTIYRRPKSQNRNPRWFGLFMPQFVGGSIAVPLWLPLTLLTFPLLLPRIRSRRNRRSGGIRVLERRWELRSRQKWRCMALSIPVFIAAFCLVPYVMEWLTTPIFGAGGAFDLSRHWGMSEASVAVILMAIWLATTYAIGRRAYIWLRWKHAIVAAVGKDGCPVCPSCFYDLRGSSGAVCSECGSALKKPTPHVPDAK